MSVIYLLSCHGDNTVEVTTAEAGRTIACPCGKQVQVPTFREIQQLPRKQVASRSEGENWSIQQGVLFSIGLVLLAGAIGTTGLLIYQRAQLDTQEIAIPDEWLEFQEAQLMQADIELLVDGWNNELNRPLPEDRHPPTFEVNRAAARVIYWQIFAAAVVGVIGLCMMGAGTMLKPASRQPRKATKRPAV